MKRIIYSGRSGRLACLVLLMLSMMFQVRSQSSTSLLGKWVSNSEMGTVYLVFHSENQLEFDGEMFYYMLIPGIIRVSDEYMIYDYPYVLQGNQLTITFPEEGYQLQFSKATGTTSTSTVSKAKKTTQKSTHTQGGTAGVTAMMKHFAGYWWHYSGSSSISHEDLIYLAPDGTYRNRSENTADITNYDQYGDVSSQYLGNFQDRSQGQWTVKGNKYKGVIIVTWADGSTYNINYEVKPSKNQRFGDYYFNGTLYCYVREEDLHELGY
jgi:hypothetical protein